MKSFYLFGSRTLSHVIFWLAYFLAFGFIWAEKDNYWESYFLEFILLPTRIAAVYITIYILIPRLLQKRRIWHMLGAYVILMTLAAVLQRLFTFFFYEGIAVEVGTLWEGREIIRNIILINSTVLFVSALKITQLWWQEMAHTAKLEAHIKSADPGVRELMVEVKADKRIYRIVADHIFFVEGMGNYVVFHTRDKKLISYSSLKQVLNTLPGQFQRIHKSYIVNMDKVSSYDQDNVEIMGKLLPLGRAYKDEVLLN